MVDIEVRFVGRGGQGVVTAAHMFARAAHLDGYAGVQSFPFFGPERRGAPVQAFLRISASEINTRSQVYEPDIVVVLDSRVMEVIDAMAGLKRRGLAVINGREESLSDVRLDGAGLAVVDATSIALQHGITASGLPVSNTSILGSISRSSGLVEMASVVKAIRSAMPERTAEKNVDAARDAYENTRMIKEPDGGFVWKR